MKRKLNRGLIVSCQAEAGSPFNAPEFIAAFAKAAELGGAVGVRIRDVENVAAVCKAVQLPIIGITKGSYNSGAVLITPSVDDAVKLVEAGADIIALDATNRIRPDGITGLDFLKAVKSTVKVPVVADISDLNEAAAAALAGADFIATTLSGYTKESSILSGEPDFELIKSIASAVKTPIIAEGRIWTPQQAAEAMESGAFAVCVGTAITRTVEIVNRFVSALSGNTGSG